MQKCLVLLFSSLIFGEVSSAVYPIRLVLSSTESPFVIREYDTSVTSQNPRIYKMDILSKISNRFATTLIMSKVRNDANTAKETSFNVILPDKAFISEFIMEIGGKKYKAFVKEKSEAERIYTEAVQKGETAAHVRVSVRNANKFTVSVNIEPKSKVKFFLTYEELLERKNDQYELILNIHPGQIVQDLNVKVEIKESRPIRFVETPPLRSGHEICNDDDDLSPSSDTQVINARTVVVTFNPSPDRQIQLARSLKDDEYSGLSGQFVVQYDVEPDPYGGEVLLQDGYFVHFFAPSNLEVLPKHVLFVLDSSASMFGRKLEQLKDALRSILKDVTEKDILTIIDFNTKIHVWDTNRADKVTIEFEPYYNYQDPFRMLSNKKLPTPSPANNATLNNMKQTIENLSANDLTNTIGAIETALYLAKLVQDSPTPCKYQPLIIFLTDGIPVAGLTSTDEITEIVTRLNSQNNKVPIFSLSFGEIADKEFLRKLSSKNMGFSRHIYEASDASLQLQDFYKEISSPSLSNIQFKYKDNVIETTKTSFPIYFKGSEIIVSGRYNVSGARSGITNFVSCFGQPGPRNLRPRVYRPVTSLERLWAYLTVKQRLEERRVSNNKEELTRKALDLALKYSFVTEVTSLVVVKPDSTSRVTTKDAYSLEDPLSVPVQQSNIVYGLNAPTSSPRGLYGQPGVPGLRGEPRFPGIDFQDTVIQYNMILPAPDDLLPWLPSVLNPNGTLTVAQNAYKLGNSNYPPKALTPSCFKTPKSATENGYCSTLSQCPEVHPYLKNFSVYKQYFCVVHVTNDADLYAGVCCPYSIYM